MIYRHLFDRLAKGKIVRAGLIGAGHFATAIATQSPASVLSLLLDKGHGELSAVNSLMPMS
jgi:predicted homoserine dehydrogenase-like protein